LPIGKYLGANICLWGVFLMIQAAAHNFAGLAALRAMAGAAEACADPSFMLITSMWYKVGGSHHHFDIEVAEANHIPSALNSLARWAHGM
jgi:MFS family permease